MRVIYQIDPGAVHKLVLVEITGQQGFSDTAKLRSYLQIQQASRFVSHGRYSQALLKSDVATLEGCTGPADSARFRFKPKLTTTTAGGNKLAVHIHIEEGVRTR